jgi:nucleotide-binding universal stress UspA family protein
MARRNPFRTEAEAFRLLLYTIAAFAAIAVASILGGWKLGVPVWLAISALAVWYYLRPLPEEAIARAPSRSPDSDEWRILVVANETVAGRELRDAITAAVAAHPSQVLVVCPALNSKLRHWASDEDAARAAAQQRLEDSLARLADAGVEADGKVGDSDPLQAMEDALRTFGADEIIISTHPEGRSNWLERGVVATARQRFAVPIAHVVVDLGAP